MISTINNLLGFRSGTSAIKYVALLSLLTFMAFNVQPAQAASVVPEEVSGNPDCDCGEYEFKIEPVENKTYTDDRTGVTFTISGTRPYFNFSIEGGTVCSVIAKGGPNANVYSYNPPVSSDNGLSAPINEKTGRPYGLSHVTFCYDLGITKIEANKSCDEQTTTSVDGQLKILSTHTLTVKNTGNFDVDLQVKETAANLECKLVAIGAAPANIALPSDPPTYVDIEYTLLAGESVDLTIECIADALNVANSANVLAISKSDEYEDIGNFSDMDECPLSPDLSFVVKKKCDRNRLQQVKLDDNLVLVVEVCPKITVENTSPDFQTLENVTVFDDLIPALQEGANIGDIEPGQTADVAQRLFDLELINYNNLCYQPSESESVPIDEEEGIKYDTAGAAFYNKVTVTAEGELDGDISTEFPISVTCPLCP